jgi:L-alanine-DL-glutamate epimerase-like enolase superfamily enzyme
MKITHVESFRVPVPAADPPFRWRDGLAGSAPAGAGGVLRIGTDQGVEGVALFSRPGAAVLLDDLVERVFRLELIGADPLQREWLWHRVWEHDRIHELPLPALGLIDVALWDLAGRLQQLHTADVELPVRAQPGERRAVQRDQLELGLGPHAVGLLRQQDPGQPGVRPHAAARRRRRHLRARAEGHVAHHRPDDQRQRGAQRQQRGRRARHLHRRPVQLDEPVSARYLRVIADRPNDGGQTGGQMAVAELGAY